MKIGIAGAGLAGRLLAMALIERGFEVELFDRCSPFAESSCAHIAAGMLAPVCESVSTSKEIMQLGFDSLELWKSIQSKLSFPFLATNGSLVVAHAREKSELDRFYEQTKSQVDLHLLDSKRLEDLEPELYPRFKNAILVEREGHVSSRVFLQAIFTYLLERGAKFHFATEILRVDAGLIVTSQGLHSFDYVVDTRGLGAKPQISNIRGVRGEVLLVQTKEVLLSRPVRLLHPRYPLYVVPRPNNQFLVGATTIECHDDSNVSVQSAMELLGALYSLHPAFAEARIIEMNARSRPAFADNEPKVLVDHRILKINGLYRHGFMVAPKIVQEVANYIQTNRFCSKFKHFVETKNHAYSF